MTRTFFVNDDKCRLDVRIYGLWTNFIYGIAQAGDPQVQVKLTCTDEYNNKSISKLGSWSNPKNLVGGGTRQILPIEFRTNFFNKKHARC